MYLYCTKQFTKLIKPNHNFEFLKQILSPCIENEFPQRFKILQKAIGYLFCMELLTPVHRSYYQLFLDRNKGN